MINTLFVGLRRSRVVKYILREKIGSVHWLLTGDISLLECFFIVCSLMNETHTMATRETVGKNGHQKSSSVPIYLRLQLSAAPALLMLGSLTYTYLLPLSWRRFSPIFISICDFFATSYYIPFFPSSVQRSVCFLHLDTSLLASQDASSHLCISDTHQSWFCFGAEKERAVLLAPQ